MTQTHLTWTGLADFDVLEAKDLGTARLIHSDRFCH